MHEKLAELRELKGLKQHEVADILGVKQNTYGKYETGDREMSYQLQRSIADYYNVSLDFLHGRTKVPAVNKDEYTNHDSEFMLKSLQLYHDIRAKEKTGR